MREDSYRNSTFFIPELSDVLSAVNLGEDHTVDDWPWGRKRRCSMHFSVETTSRGQRLVKQSTMDGRSYKPKKTTFADRVVIVEIDGKIGHVELSRNYHMAGVTLQDSSYTSPTFHDAECDEIAAKFFSA